MTRLTIELVPASAWGQNVRQKAPESLWEDLRWATYKRARYRCEICGRGDTPLQCHEVWSYEEHFRVRTESAHYVQKLVGLVALCNACHLVKHFGRAKAVGREREARAHLMKVNGWSEKQADHHIKKAFIQWNARSSVQWELDLSYIETWNNQPEKRRKQ